MKHAALSMRTPQLRAALLLPVVVAIALAVTGCAATKDHYAAGEDAQQRQAFETATEAKASANIDTQATYLKVVDQMQQQGLWFASLAHIDALEQRWGVSPDSTRMRADALRQTGQAAPAEAAYKRLLATPLESAGYRGLGLLAGARGNFAEATQLLRQAQRRTPTDALLLSDLGYASLRAGQFDEARLPLMQALQLRPDSTQAQANLALYFEATNQREQATALMDANRMPEATRAAVRDAAQQMRGTRGPVAPVTTAPAADAAPVVSAVPAAPAAPAAVAPVAVAPAPDAAAVATLASDDAAAVIPLALKPSRWAGMGGVRTASQLNPSASAAAAPLTPTPITQGTP